MHDPESVVTAMAVAIGVRLRLKIGGKLPMKSLLPPKGTEVDSLAHPAIHELSALLEELTSIGAPTFREKRRSDFIKSWLCNNVDDSATNDEIGNVWLDLSKGGDRLHLVDAHIDTVFSYETVTIRKDRERWWAPGILDNTVSCAMLMMWAKMVARNAGVQPILLTFTVGEEGEGNLRGMRQTNDRFGSRLASALVLDLSLDAASFQAVGSSRFRIGWKTAGGHSWSQFGQPSAIHEMARWVTRLENAFPWKEGSHSFNVGTVEGGVGVNVIAEHAQITLDVRSIDPDFLQDLDKWMEQAAASKDENIAITSVDLGKRPASSLDPDASMVAAIEQIHRDLEIPLRFAVYSTNGNTLLASNIPTITTGLALGGGIHTEHEYLEVASLPTGFAKLCQLLASRLASRNCVHNGMVPQKQ